MTEQHRLSRPRGMHPLVLILAYLTLALLPLALSAALGEPRRPWRDEAASAFGMVGFAMLMLEFVLSGRFRSASGRVGIDLTMRAHRLLAWVVVVLLVVHPFFYQSSWTASGAGWGSQGLGLTGASALTGALALLLLVALVAIAVSGIAETDYEGWRRMHGIGAIAIVLLATHHTLAAGRYAQHPTLIAFWSLMLAGALVSYAYVHILTPLRQRRTPYRVTVVRPLALKTWELVVEPVEPPAIEFDAGQFVWLRLDRSPFSIVEHPFSIASCPADRPRIAFAIKEAGDHTRRIGNIPVGARAYLDGPHGNFTLTGRGGDGIVFIAGGVGLASIMSILRQLRAERDRRPLILIHGNRVREQILWPEELAAMADEMSLAVHHVLAEPPPGWQGEVGQPDEAALRRLVTMPDRAAWLYFVCGPTPMIRGVRRSLRCLGVPRRQIVAEQFRFD